MSPPGTHFTAESTEAMQIKCLAQGHDILMPEFAPSASVSRNRHSNHMTNMLPILILSHALLISYLEYDIFVSSVNNVDFRVDEILHMTFMK